MPGKIEVCFSPALYKDYYRSETVVVVTDILRATSAICTAFHNGVKDLIPVETLDEAKKYKEKGYIVAAERDGIKLDFADFGNSPYNFTPEAVAGKTIVYSTTNGTEAIHLAAKCYRVIIGSFLNLTSVCEYLNSLNRDIVVLCAGWKDKFSLEDTVHAGAVVEIMTERFLWKTDCDSALAALDLWKICKQDMVGYLDKCAQRSRLRKNNLDDVIGYCLTPDMIKEIPVFHNGKLSELHNFATL